jgi:DNA helicase II / ATP-dependent DNA helicase PcrA
MQFEKLNPEQLKAVNHIEGPMLVLAGAGSGKTRVVTQRIAHLIEIGIVPSDILAVTFTNKAANEMKERVKKITQASILTCTFHSLGARILRESIQALQYKSDFSIYDEEDSLKLIKNCLETVGIKEEKGFVKSIKFLISQAKNDLLADDEININSFSSSEEKGFYQVYPLYQKKLREYNAVDFDDLLFLPVTLLRKDNTIKEKYQNRWLFLLIDEYQDTNAAQNILAKLLAEKHKNIFVVGDPDQSIYSWRGAKYENILNFDKDFPEAKIITLEENYRSTNTILSAANSLIKNNEQRLDKNLWSNLGEGEKISIHIADTEKLEAIFVVNRLIDHHIRERAPLEEMVIFYRTNAQSRIFEDILLSEKIPYVIYGGLSFYQRKEIKDLIAFMRMIFSDSDFISFTRTINIPKRGIGPASISKLLELSENHQTSILKVCAAYVENPDRFIGVKLSKKQLSSLLDYLSLISSFRDLALKKPPISQIISEIILRSGFLSYLKEDPETFEERKENIDELIAKAADYEETREAPTLHSFLEEISLLSNLESEEKKETVKLMTLHNSKGLEFSYVFMVGMEEEVFPHVNSTGSAEELEEERRLCYVGMTRAKKKLYLTAAIYRYLWGYPKIMIPSRFLKEIPAKYLENISTQSSFPKIEEKLTLQKEEIEKETEFTPGSQVMHKSFGIGKIIKSYHTSMGETYDIKFNSGGPPKTIIAKYAKLKKI